MPAARGTPSPRPGDMTAIRKQALEKEHAEELAERAEELAMTAQAEKDDKDVLHDYFKGAGEPLPEQPKVKDELPYRDIRIKAGIEQMAYGVEIRTEKYTDEHGVERVLEVPGNVRLFDFEEGKQYRLPRDMADYLDAKGYVFH